MSDSLDDESYYEGLSFSGSINPNFEVTKYNKMLLVDSFDMTSFDVFKEELEKEYTKCYYSENASIEMKLKLNVSEFIFVQNNLFPRLGEVG